MTAQDALASTLLANLLQQVELATMPWQEAIFCAGVAVGAFAQVAASHNADPDTFLADYPNAARAAFLHGLRVSTAQPK